MSILGLIVTDASGSPFSATVGPAILFRSEDTGINVTNAFVATPAGTGPYTYLWSSGSDITPNTPTASSCTYTINTVLAPLGENAFTCTVTDTATGEIFAAPFSIFMTKKGGRLDENPLL